jgi:cytochrome P450
MSHPPQPTSRAADTAFCLPIFDGDYKANPYPTLRNISDSSHGVARVTLPSGLAAWIITRHELATMVLNDRRFRKSLPATSSSTQPSIHPIFQHMLGSDPPEHTRLRARVSREFVSRQIGEQRGFVETSCNALIARLVRQQEIELVADFAVPAALATICAVIGLPQGDAATLQRWSERLLQADFDNPQLFPVIGDEIHDYLDRLLERTDGVRPASLFSRLARQVADGALSRNEMFAMIFLLVSAGYETSANLISASVLTLLEHPEHWSAICAQPTLAAAAVDELLRFASPLEMSTPRLASTDVNIAGTLIREGDTVFVALGAANRDCSLFDEPDKFDIARANAKEHVAFGHGIHFCLGAQLARLQAEIAIGLLATHLPGLCLHGAKQPPRWLPGLVMRGLAHLHLINGQPAPIRPP